MLQKSRQPLRTGLKYLMITLMACLSLYEEVQTMYAIFETGGKQYRVEVGQTLYIEKLDKEVGEKVVFDRVLLVGDTVGSPFVEGASVEAVVDKQGKQKKIIVYKYKPKKSYHKKQGHRQPYTKVTVTAINQ